MEKSVTTAGPARGIILPEKLARLGHERVLPPPDLSPWIRHFWWVEWDLAVPRIQENLPHPSLHLVFEAGRAEVVGVPTGRFRAELSGQGWVLGAKFEPGAFSAFCDLPASELTNRRVDACELFGAALQDLKRQIFEAPEMQTRIGLLAPFLLSRARPLSRGGSLSGRLVRRLENDQTILRVEDLCAAEAISARKVQRLFQKYVGVSPKWVIGRYRIHEALARLERSGRKEPVDWPAFALELGYYDQAHFINDFSAAVGLTPDEYDRAAGR